MSDKSLQNDEFNKIIKQRARALSDKSEAERRVMIEQAVDQAMAEELAERRAESQREALAVRDALTRDTPQEEALRARRSAPKTILLLVLLFLILYLIAAATGRENVLMFPGTQDAQPTFEPRIESNNIQRNDQLAADPLSSYMGDIAPLNSLNGPAPEIGERFRDYYNQNGGEPIFGLPISAPLTVNNRLIQWFQRARLEHWPEYAPTRYEIQGGRTGTEFTRVLTFPKQSYFVNRPGMRYFAETSHGVTSCFLDFWERTGGLPIHGFPISEQVQELLPEDRQIHTVQYFERTRIELHSPPGSAECNMKIGLLGSALYLQNSKPEVIQPLSNPTPAPAPPAPTPVP
jgi:hypothetical protein